MDKTVFINELKDLFGNVIKKEGKSYSKIWLSEANYGGLYHSGGYILNVKAKKHFEVYTKEIKYLSYMIHDKLDKEKTAIFHCIAFYNDDENIPEEKGDIAIYDEG